MTNRIQLWCDAGGNNTGDRCGGIGVVFIYGDALKLLSEGFVDTTNNRMEMTSVIRGMKSLKRKDVSIDIYSDSAYVVNCFIEGWYHKWRANNWKTSEGKLVLNVDLWEEMIELYESFKNIDFIKVKGHIGIPYNELADLLATIAIVRVSKGLTNKEIIGIIENRENKPKRYFIGKYNLSEKHWTDFRTKGKEWLDLLKQKL